MVPEGWEAASLGQLVLDGFRNGFSPNAPEKPTGRYVLALSALAADGFNERELKLAPNVDAVVQSELRPGDFLISRSNTRERVGFTAMFRGEVANCSYPDLMMRFRPKTEYVVPEFLEQQLRSRRTLGYLQGAAAGTSASMVKLNSTTVSKAPVWLPPIPEQRKIAEILGTWDRAIEVAEQQLETARTQKRALMQQLLTGTKRFPEFEGQPWREVRANEIFRTVSIKRNEEEPLLAVTQDQGILLRDELERRVVMPDGSTAGYKLVVPGNFVISLRSFQGGLEYSKVRGLVSPAYHVLEPVVEISDSFFKHYFKSYQFIGRLAVAIIGIRDGKQISYNDFSYLKFPCPELREQEAIGECLDAAQSDIDAKVSKIDRFRTEKKALMQQLLTGKRRVSI